MVIGKSRAADKKCSVPPEHEGDFVNLTYAIPSITHSPEAITP